MSQPVRNCTRLLLGILLLVACGSASSRDAAGPILLVDDAGDTLRLERPARRVVSLIPATTEWLFAIGAGEQVVGRTKWCDYPEAALAVPNVGDGLSPNLEVVVGAAPDLVILYQSPQNRDAAERLRALGVAVLTLRTDRLADMVRQIAQLGQATGHAAAAARLTRTFERDLAVATVAEPLHRPSVLLLAWDQPPIVLGEGSFLSELVTRAGGRNVFDDLAAPSGQVGLEAIAGRNPDLVLTTSEGPPPIADRPEWRTVEAVRGGRFVRVTGSEFSRPSPRAPAAVRELAGRIAAALADTGVVARP